jgi:hypothetical protein
VTTQFKEVVVYTDTGNTQRLGKERAKDLLLWGFGTAEGDFGRSKVRSG